MIFKGGEKVNIGLIQVVGGSAQQMIRSGNADMNKGGTFGSILSKLTAQSEPTPIAVSGNNSGGFANESLTAVFNATTTEELEIALEELNYLIPGAQFLEEGKLGDFKQIDVSALLEYIMPLLEQHGMSESELQAASTITDIWSLLNVLDQVAPKFFEEVLHTLEGKGEHLKDQAIELLVLLKTVAVQAAATDLTTKEEQQLFSLQGFLQATAERFESSLQPPSNRNNLLHLMETQHPIRVEVQNETTNGNLKEETKETVQQSSINLLTATRAEALSTELENKQNARNEALMREMQNIFKRSNFGQTGGTNRLLVKLYPEHLGQVRIELLQVNGIMTARILASTALGKEMLDSQLAQLRSAFLQQNLQVDRIDVLQTLQDTPRNDRDHAFNQHFRQSQEEFEEHDDQNEEEQMTFQEYMIELEA